MAFGKSNKQSFASFRNFFLPLLLRITAPYIDSSKGRSGNDSYTWLLRFANQGRYGKGSHASWWSHVFRSSLTCSRVAAPSFPSLAFCFFQPRFAFQHASSFCSLGHAFYPLIAAFRFYGCCVLILHCCVLGFALNAVAFWSFSQLLQSYLLFFTLF